MRTLAPQYDAEASWHEHEQEQGLLHQVDQPVDRAQGDDEHREEQPVKRDIASADSRSAEAHHEVSLEPSPPGSVEFSANT